MTVAPNIVAEMGRFQAVLENLQQFDNAELLPVVKGLSPTDRERCFIAAYYRTVANVRTLLILKDPSHFQAIAMLARAMFELAVDVRLIDGVPDAIEKIYAFSDAERLRAARDTVALAKAGRTDDDVSIQEAFIVKKGATIDARCQTFWKAKRVNHWSAMGLRDRAKKLGAPFEEMYELMYAQLSWDVHPGVTGVLNLDASAFPAKCGLAFKIAFDSYADVLRAVASELKIDKSVERLDDKVKLAMMLPFTDSPEQAIRLRNVLLS